ncbi:endonuclease-reverse transcriptase [Plakobranchus ocellatus]|uniref:Endonuclease-reverse transcriptase n=1 Tax=Plakobranchus ocellatus TaxID=259542 RepID=A0AAV4AP72_9GAST|nr:endonuclease-reverse transcriptase [Plakobranchus ocellatus]
MEAATEVIPKVKRKTKQKWMTEEILNMMEERRCAEGNKEKYEQIHKKVQEKCNMSKENWINEKCKEIEQQRKHAPQTMYRNIEEITGKRTFLSTGCLKAMNGDIIIDKEKILERWAEYIRELFKDYRKGHNVMVHNFAGPLIMKEEVETAIKKMKNGKATGPDNISVELIEALEDFGTGKVTHLLNEIYDTGQIPTDLSKVCHDEIITQLKQLNIDGKDLRIKTMYWEQTAAMRIENKTSTFQDIKRGVRQGCVLSPDLFSLYSEIIMRNLENHPGIKVGGQTIKNLRYADDTVLIAENKEDLQKLLNIVEEGSRKKGLELNSKKTEVMVISRKQESPKCDIFINEVKLKQTEKFKYLGTIISNDGKTNREISARTAQAKINFQKMKTILTNKHISIETRKRALQCYIEPVLMYGCEAWTISKQIQNKLEVTEMWFLRRMLRIPLTAKKTNERVLNEANKRRSLVRTIRKRQATFLDHVMRRGKLEHLVTTGKIEGKRSRER